MSIARKVSTAIKRHFLSGVLVVVPLILTYLVLRFLFETIDGVLQPVVQHLLGYYIPGLGILVTVLIILLAGILTRNFIGARVYALGDRLLARVPIIRPVYSAAKQLLQALARPTASAFKEVVLVEYPRRGTYSLGFVTGRMSLIVKGQQREFAAVLIPSTPTPVSGFVVMVPADEIVLINMTVEAGVQFLVSGGVASPLRIVEATA